MFVKNRVSMPGLDPTKTHPKQMFWNLWWFQPGPHEKVVQSRSLKTRIHPWTPELWSSLGCHPNICVQPTFGAKPPTAQKQLLLEVHSLRIIFWSLGLFQAGPHQKIVQSSSLKTEIDLVDPELWSILGCQPYIYVQPTLGAKPPMAHRVGF